MLKVVILKETENESMSAITKKSGTFSDRINSIVEKLTAHEDVEAVTIDVIPMAPIMVSGGVYRNQVMIRYCVSGMILEQK